jgi:hypothetical protein
MDPFSSQWKERKECDINIKSDYEATVRGESLSRKCIQKSKEGYNYITFPTHCYFSIKGQSSQDILCSCLHNI